MERFEFDPSEDKRGYAITILVDDHDSWILPWTRLLKETISPFHEVVSCSDKEEMPEGDMAFLLGCTKMLPAPYLKRSKLNLVVHESDLPGGRGWSPVAWQVSGGIDNIPVVLFDAREELDAGPIYLRDFIELDGTELLPDIRRKQGKKTVEMVLRFLERWPDLQPGEQLGEPTVYPRRTRENDRLDVNKTIAEHFDHLRIVDNERYPAWFEHRGKKYTLKIFYKD